MGKKEKEEKNLTVNNNQKNTDPDDKNNEGGGTISKKEDKITLQEFVKKERISPWVVKVFSKQLKSDEYTEKEFKKQYNEFIVKDKKEEVKK